MKMDKKQLRAQVKDALGAMSSEQIAAQSAAIWARLEALDAFAAAENIALYWSMPSEVATHDFLEKWKGSKNIFLPVVEGQDMSFRRYQSAENMSVNRFGIGEPAAEPKIEPEAKSAIEPNAEPEAKSAAEPNNTEPLFDLIIVPALGYDRQGHRLGHGGGFYDRYFAKMQNANRNPQIKIGVCFDCQLLAHVPTEEFDVDLNIVITPSAVLEPK